MLFKIQVEGVVFQADPDSGSQANLMDEQHFDQLRKEIKHEVTLKPPKNKLVSVNREPLKLKGMFNGTIETS